MAWEISLRGDWSEMAIANVNAAIYQALLNEMDNKKLFIASLSKCMDKDFAEAEEALNDYAICKSGYHEILLLTCKKAKLQVEVSWT